MQIKDMSAISAKWSQRAQAAGADYASGVKNTQKDWAALTASAADNFAAGVQQAVADGRFARGVQAAGSDKWRSAAAGKGAQRYPSGVASGQAAYNAGFAPYQAVIAALPKLPRSPRGSPNNMQLVSQVTGALHAKKLQG